MRVRWVAYAVTAVIAAIAGVAIAGLPSRSDDTEVVDPASELTVPTTTLPSSDPITAATTTDEVTTVATPVASDRSAPGTSEGSSESAATTAAATSTPTSTSAPPQLVPRARLVVGVANTSALSGIAERMSRRLVEVGYEQARNVDGEPLERTTVYFASGLEAEAARLAADARLPDVRLAPMEEAPATNSARELELLLALGLDYDPSG